MTREPSEAAVLKAARKFAAVIGISWDGLRDGNARGRGYDPFRSGTHLNARKGDYMDAARAILKAGASEELALLAAIETLAREMAVWGNSYAMHLPPGNIVRIELQKSCSAARDAIAALDSLRAAYAVDAKD